MGAPRSGGFPGILALSAFLLISAAGPPTAEGGVPLLPGGSGDWAVVEPPRFYGPDNLYMEIDGEAELFLQYEFREMTSAIVGRVKGNGRTYRVERFLHGDPREAFGVYSQHRFPDQKTVRIDSSEAILSGMSLDTFRGSCFIRIRAGGDDPGTREDLLALGRALLGMIPGKGDPPAETRAFRIPGVVPGTIVYQKRAILGDERLSPGFEAKFDAGGVQGTLLLIPQTNAGEGGAIKRLATLPGWAGVGPGMYRADLSRGPAWFSVRGDSVLGVAAKLPRPQAFEMLHKMDEALGTPAR
ncbi:MAG: hypothetical protein FIA93_00310 [Deltaproteobacteria bacterium]|nr:hypothetical protein [Deltaproteobacteria bacterium]PWB67578.1 MAG: hypothetical protein C3F14_01700 [Deltaproteobacteria bacterium]